MMEDEGTIRFPDSPKTDLDTALVDVVAAAGRVLSAQGRLRALMNASQAIVQLTHLPDVLKRIAEVALELVDARYAALGVLAPDGTLEQFIHVGMSAADARAIGHLPEGHGLLGALIDDPRPIRLAHLGTDRRSSGFPVGHPQMDSFLGVPIRVRDEVFGNIYVTERRSGEFTEEDQELLTALAATAGTAIDNARLMEETLRRQRWSSAAAEVTSILLSDVDVGEQRDDLGLIAERVLDLAEAELVAVVLEGPPGTLVVDTARGPASETVRGLTIPSAGTLTGRALQSAQPVMADSNAMTDSTPSPWIELGPTIAIPLAAASDRPGAITVSRQAGGRRFTAADLDMVADFAGQAGVALALARGREDKLRLAVFEDRSRIARDLHDHVIQRLFAAGLDLQALPLATSDARTRAKIGSVIQALDASIVEIRTAVFTLVSPDPRSAGALRHRIVDVIAEASAGSVTAPRVVMSGPIDLVVPEEMAPDLLAVVREALANVTRHAHATETVVSVRVDEDRVVIDVTDDGVGVSPGGRSSGIANLETRARELGGDFTLANRDSGGAHLRWSAPLPQIEE
jgi:signal transduction histidine kinase